MMYDEEFDKGHYINYVIESRIKSNGRKKNTEVSKLPERPSN